MCARDQAARARLIEDAVLHLECPAEDRGDVVAVVREQGGESARELGLYGGEVVEPPRRFAEQLLPDGRREADLRPIAPSTMGEPR